MTISSTNSRVDAIGNDSTATYNYTFRIFLNTDLQVTVRDSDGLETQLTLTTDYTVTGVGSASGGTIVLVHNNQDWISSSGYLDNDYTITIKRVVPLTQITDIRNQGDFYPETHEDQFDKLTMIDQQQQDAIDRSITLPVTIDPSDFSTELPVPEASKYIRVNVTNDGFEFANSTASNIVNDDVSSSASIERSKLESGTANHVIINNGSGVMSSEATLSKSRGGTGQDNSSLTFPASGTITENAASQTLTNKTINIDSNTVSNIANANIKAAAAIDATKIADGSISNTEFQYLNNVSSNIQTQLDTKAPLAAPSFTSYLEAAQIATPASPASSKNRLYFKSDEKLYKLTSGGVETEIGAGFSVIDTLSNIQSSTLTEGVFYYATDKDEAFISDGTYLFPINLRGTEKNFIKNYTSVKGTTSGWATYADAAGSSPVDGTGGTANITWTSSSSTPFDQNNYFTLTKDASNRQGQGVSFDFTVDPRLKSNQVVISFDYSVVSGTYATGDLKVFLYDVTNSALVTMSGNDLDPLKEIGTGSSSFYKHTVPYTLTSGTSYRLILHVSTTSSSAYTLSFDNFFVGPYQNRKYLARMQSTAGQTIEDAGSGEIVVWDTRSFETTQIFDTSTGIATIAENGVYYISAIVGLQSVTWTNGDFISLSIRVNSSAVATYTEYYDALLVSTRNVPVFTMRALKKGDTLDVFIDISRVNGNANLSTSGAVNNLYMMRVF